VPHSGQVGELRKMELTGPQRLWLEAWYSKTRNGEPVSPRSVMIELRGKLPAGFDPSEIDSRLLRGGTGITLLGIASVDPRSELVAKADEVLRAVREFLSVKPDAASVDVSDLTRLTGNSEKELAEAFYRLSFLGVFHKSGTVYGADAWKTINVTEQAFAGYFSYETVDQLLKSILSESKGQGGEASDDDAGPAPTKPSDADSVTSGFRRADVAQPHAFVLGQPVPLEETRHVEFKELSGKNPADSIKNTADEYAVAYLNREGGKIYWGVRNSDRVAVGVKLDYAQRDAVRRVVSEKLSQIKPPIPISAFSCEFHPVRDDAGHVTPDLYVCELDVPKGSDRELYATGGGEVFVKTDGGKRKLDVQQIIAEATRRRAAGHTTRRSGRAVPAHSARREVTVLVHRRQPAGEAARQANRRRGRGARRAAGICRRVSRAGAVAGATRRSSDTRGVRRSGQGLRRDGRASFPLLHARELVERGALHRTRVRRDCRTTRRARRRRGVLRRDAAYQCRRGVGRGSLARLPADQDVRQVERQLRLPSTGGPLNFLWGLFTNVLRLNLVANTGIAVPVRAV
jgi:hypothetical protein